MSRRKISDEPMTVEFAEDGGTVTVSPKGRLDSVTSPVFLEQAEPRCKGRSVVLDLSELTYMSSAGLRCVLGLDRSCEAMRIVNAQGSVRDVLEMSGFGEFIDRTEAPRDGPR